MTVLNIDLEEIAAVVRLIKGAEFSEFRYAKGDVSLVVRRGELPADSGGETTAAAAPTPPPAPKVVAPVPARQPGAPPRGPGSETALQGPSSSVTAPLLGSFYGAPKPGDPPFVRVGDRVEPDTVVCIIEVMKLMNSVVAGVGGTITAVHASDGELVEHGQALFTIQSVEPA